MSDIKELGHVRFHGMQSGKNVSAVTIRNDRAFIVGDELTPAGNIVEEFQSDGEDFRSVPKGTIRLDPDGASSNEMDLEGLAADAATLFVLGSHSAKRPKVNPKYTCFEN